MNRCVFFTMLSRLEGAGMKFMSIGFLQKFNEIKRIL